MLLDIPELARPADEVDFSDITPSKRVAPAYWVAQGKLEIVFDVNPTPAQVQRIITRLTTKNVNEETIKAAALAALVNNAAWRANTLPSLISGANAIIGSATANATEKDLARGIKGLATQLGDITNQSNELIRLVLQQLDATD